MYLKNVKKTWSLALLAILLFIGISGKAQMRQVYVGVNADNQIYKISMYSPAQGFVAFRDWIGYTADSGHTFIQKNISTGNVNFNGYSVNLTFGFGISGVKAFNQNNILVYGDYGLVPAILSSADGGSTFTLIYHSQYDQFQLSTGITDMIFPQNNNIGYAVDADRILKTINQGASWSVLLTAPGSFFNALEASDNNNVIAMSTDYATNKIVQTFNGSTWQAVPLPSITMGKIRYAYFLNGTTGWVNMYDDNNRAYLYKTINSGGNWTLLNNLQATPFTCDKMRFYDVNTGYALTGQNTVSKTLNGGITWEPLPRDNNYAYLGYSHNDFQLFSATQLWAGGGHGFLEMSTNGGGTPLPKAYFNIDTTGEAITSTVNLTNYSRTGYTYKWFVNEVQVSSSYNASYTHDVNRILDTVKLVVINGSNTDTSIKYQGFNPPVIVSSFTPVTAGSGYLVTITGLNFNGATTVSFGGVHATGFTVVSNTSITATVGSGASGNVQVNTPTGQGSLAGFTFLPPPTITSFAPTAAAAGTVVTITGTNFSAVTAVNFGGIPATSFNVVSPTSITATAPSGTSGTVSVTTTGGTASLAGYIALPTITSFTPTHGTQGTVLTITGTSLSGVTAVTIGGVNALSFVINSSTSITAVVGAGASGAVVVTKTGGTSSLAGFTWVAAPVITSFAPMSGPIGTSVTITGTGFSAVPANNIVYFGAAKATVTNSSITSITVTVPTGATFETISASTGNLIAYSAYPFLVTFANGGSISAASFSTATVLNIAPDYYATNITTADIDRDGKNDLIVSERGSGSVLNGVLIYRNTSTLSTISFDNPINLGNLDGKEAAAGDLDGDGKLDLAIVKGYFIATFINNSVPGTIAFIPSVTLTIGNPIKSIALADMDADGKEDIVESGSEIMVFKNVSEAGNLAFNAGVTVCSCTSDRNILATDIDGDKKPDIVLSGLGVLKNNSSPGNFSFDAPVATVDYLYGYVAAGDMDRDGKTDLVFSDYYGSHVSVQANTSTPGTISFAAPVVIDAATGPMGVTVSDMDGDGKADIAAALFDYSIAVIKNNSVPGNLLFAAATKYTAGTFSGTHLLTASDINGDGKNDIIATIEAGQSITVHLNNVKPEPNIVSFNPTIGMAGTPVNMTGTNFTGITAVSFGGIPAASFIVNSSTSITAIVGAGGAGNVTVTNNYGTGSLAGFAFGLAPVVTSFTPVFAAAGATVTITGSNFSATPANNTVYFGSVKAAVTASTATSITTAVPFGSLQRPLTVTNNGLTGTNGNMFTTTFAGGGSLSQQSFPITYNRTGIAAGCVADIDSDGKLDFIAPGSAGLVVAKNMSTTGNLSFANNQTINTTSGLGNPVAYDLDGDGKLDLAATSGTNSFSTLRNLGVNGTISFGPAVAVSLGATSSNPMGLDVSDIDGDGKPDVAVAIYDNQHLSVFKNNSTTGSISFSDHTDYTLDQYATQVVLSDLDGDQKPEMIGTHTGPQSFSIFRNTSVPGTISFAPKTDYGSIKGYITIADIDKDGKPDIICLTAGVITIYRNLSVTGSISFAPGIDFPAGNSTYLQRVTANDLNGDGLPDILVSNSNLQSISIYQNNSTPGNIVISTKINFTTGADVSACTSADMDNDGKADIISSNSPGLTIWRNQSGGNGPTILSFSPVSAVTGNTVTITGNNFNGVTAVKFGAVAAASFTLVSNNSIDAVVGAGATGSISVTTASGLGSLSGFTYSPLPTITSIYPATATPGATLTITGANFTGTTAISFNGTPATSFIVNSSTSITVVTGQGGSGDVVITTASGTGVYPGFIFYDVPTISSFNPLFGSTGSSITITGTNFTGATAVSFGDYPVQSFTVNSSTSITAVSSAGNSGDVKVTTPGGTASLAGYLYQAAPTFFSFFPTTATTGNTVTITGTNFTNVSAVSFGGTPASSFTIVSPTQINAVVGSGTTGNISLTNPNGTGSTGGFTFATAATPIIAAFAPTNAGTGCAIIISGVNFTNVTSVKFGGTNAASYVVNSPTQITAIVASGTSGDISVTTAGGTGVLAGFIYTTVPVITSFLPAAGIPGGTLIIKGSNFNTVAASNIVYFGTAKATVQSANATTLTVTIPIGATYSLISVTNSNLTGYSSQAFLPTFIAAGPLDAGSFSVKLDSIVTGPKSVTLGDLDLDGKLDLGVPVSGNLGFYRNTSSPGVVALAAKINQPQANGPTKMVYADFNGDGKMDIATGNATDGNAINIQQNTSTPGNISFTAGPLLTAGIGPFNVLSADFDKDGKPDLAFTGYFYSAIFIKPNTSTLAAISFGATTTFATPNAAASFAIADVDLDGKPDVIVCNAFAISIARNISTPGNIAFTVLNFPGYGNYNGSLVTGDIDGDGKPDIAFITGNNSTGISVVRNRSTPGNIQLDARVDFPGIGNLSSLNIADMDGNGKPDLVFGNSVSNILTILRNKSNIGYFDFDQKLEYPTNSSGNTSSIGDIDGDGKPDIVIAYGGINAVTILRNQLGNNPINQICPNGTVTLTSNITGASYQWQQNAGSGFVNISNNSNFAGTNTVSLQITNTPPAWYGYRYRCLVSGNVSTVYQLISANTWTGAVSNLWENPANWSCGVLPNSYTDVIINSGTVIVGSNVIIRSLTVNPGVGITVMNGFNMTILH